MADIPSEGSGLGSSSTVTVGLLNAMYTYLGNPKDHAWLAQEACEIEIGILGKPIGKQDQYIAAYGGQRFLRFCPDEEVEIEPILGDAVLSRRFNQNLMLFYTNVARKAESILTEQRDNIGARIQVLRDMKHLALQARVHLHEGQLDEVGHLMHTAWLLKKQMASKISSPEIDRLYDTARTAGALGGKITGAGGGGFLMLYCPREKQDAVRGALQHLSELPFHLERDGTKVIFNYRR